MEIKYLVRDRSPPLSIHNDMGVHVYLDQRRVSADFFSKYPLCITLKKRIIEDVMAVVEADRNSISGRTGYQDLYSTDSICLIGITSNEGVHDVDEDDISIIGDCRSLEVKVNQVYKDKNVLMDVIKHHAFVNKFRFTVIRSSLTCYYLKCPSENCSWFLNASTLNQSTMFMIRKYCDLHTCSIKERIYARRQGITDVVAIIIMDKFVDERKIYTPKDIVEDMLRLHGVCLTYMQAWRAKDKAIKMLRGDPAESYARIPGYLYILEKHYPGSVVDLEKTSDGRFLYAFVALDASIRGWEYCRPIVVVDGAALKCTYKGTILIASTVDPGGHILPLAYAIADSENDASWTWFFEKFKVAFGERENMCFVSDMNESIWKGTSRVYPYKPHHACIWHLWTNVLKKCRKNAEEVKKLFFAMEKAYTLQEFEELMGRMDAIDKKLRGYLFEVGYEKWSRAHSPVNRAWTMTSNIAESVNNINPLARRLPVLSLLDFMRIKIQAWNAKYSTEARNTNTDLTAKYNEVLEANRELSYRMMVSASTQFLHAVTDGAKRFTVCLRTRNCSCGRFQKDEIPCGHAMAAIRYRSLHGEDYTSHYYSRRNFEDAYAIPVEPLPCESIWDIPSELLEPKLLPPDFKRQPGRPPLERWKSFGENKSKRTKVTCGACGQVGHNRRTCSRHPPEI